MNAYRLAWIGREDEACQRLLERFLRTCDELGYAPGVVRQHTLDLTALPNCDRIVLVAANRSDFSHDAIAALANAQSIVPYAVVTGSWHIGSRRSGEGPITHWQQPWFRWYDCWLGWFFPEVARPGSLVANALGPLVTPADFATPSQLPDAPPLFDEGERSRLGILSACPPTGSMLCEQALLAGWQAEVYRSHEELPPRSEATFHAMLWDDSLLTCLPGTDLKEPVSQLVQRLARYVSVADVITSLDLSHQHLHAYLRELGCGEMLIKPSYSLALSNCLHYRSVQRQVAWQQVQAIDD